MVNVRAVERDQQFLMPPSLSDWLPEDHLAWFIIDLVAELDLAELYASLRADGRGGASYHPEMMLGVLLYAYCVGERSSRRIERRLTEDVAFRVVAANQCPDHATLARFRSRHGEAIAGLFSQVLGLCGHHRLRPLVSGAAGGDGHQTARQTVEHQRADRPGLGPRRDHPGASKTGWTQADIPPPRDLRMAPQ